MYLFLRVLGYLQVVWHVWYQHRQESKPEWSLSFPSATRRETTVAFIVSGIILVPMVIVFGLWLHSANAAKALPAHAVTISSHYSTEGSIR